MDQLPILLIPTLPERNKLLGEALASLKGKQELFKHIVISININCQKKDLAKTTSTINLHLSQDKPGYTILKTTSRITAVEHGRLYAEHIRKHWGIKNLIFILADDDLVGDKSDLRKYISRITGSKTQSLGIGRFKMFEETPRSARSSIHYLLPGETIDSHEFLQRCSDDKPCRETSISSMIVPLKVLIDLIRFQGFMGSSGRRTEYMIATHGIVREIYSPKETSAYIRYHASNEGKILSDLSKIRDEIVYSLWLYVHQKACRPWYKKSDRIIKPTFMSLRYLIFNYIKGLLSNQN